MSSDEWVYMPFQQEHLSASHDGNDRHGFVQGSKG